MGRELRPGNTTRTDDLIDWSLVDSRRGSDDWGEHIPYNSETDMADVEGRTSRKPVRRDGGDQAVKSLKKIVRGMTPDDAEEIFH